MGTTVALYNQGKQRQVDSLLAWLAERRDRLSVYHDLRRRSLEAVRDGDGERAYRLELRRAEEGPTPKGSYNAANLANQLNRPADALALLEDLDPDGPGLRGWAQYWTQLAHAHHALGSYGKEYETAAEMWARFPERRIGTVLIARALAADGRTAELDSALTALRRLPSDTYWSLGAALVVAGEEVRAHHGDNAAAAAYFAQAVDWLESRLVEDPTSRSHRYWLASAEYDLEHYDRARRRFDDLSRAFPERSDFRHHHAVSLAQLGGVEAARALLASDGEPVHGYQFAARARVEAVAGETERSLALLTEGLRRGIDGLPWLHASTLPDLGRLAEDPRYADVFGRAVPTMPMP
jgi:tetratricopeptide (TPR) repeat protein